MGAALLAACTTYRYDQRDFGFVAEHPPSGLLFINVVSTGHWQEDGVHVSGAPYTLVFAPRLKDRPDGQCALTVRNLILSPVSAGRPVLARSTWELRAEPVNPHDPVDRTHSAYFNYAPAEAAFMATGAIEGLMLDYEPHRLQFQLEGGPTCPDSIREPIKVDVVLKPDRMSGALRWWEQLPTV